MAPSNNRLRPRDLTAAQKNEIKDVRPGDLILVKSSYGGANHLLLCVDVPWVGVRCCKVEAGCVVSDSPNTYTVLLEKADKDDAHTGQKGEIRGVTRCGETKAITGQWRGFSSDYVCNLLATRDRDNSDIKYFLPGEQIAKLEGVIRGGDDVLEPFPTADKLMQHLQAGKCLAKGDCQNGFLPTSHPIWLSSDVQDRLWSDPQFDMQAWTGMANNICPCCISSDLATRYAHALCAKAQHRSNSKSDEILLVELNAALRSRKYPECQSLFGFQRVLNEPCSRGILCQKCNSIG